MSDVTASLRLMAKQHLRLMGKMSSASEEKIADSDEKKGYTSQIVFRFGTHFTTIICIELEL